MDYRRKLERYNKKEKVNWYELIMGIALFIFIILLAGLDPIV